MNIYKFIALLVLTTFLMGSSFAIVKLGLPYSSPLLLATLRFLLAGAIMAVIVIAFRRPHPTSNGSWIKILIIGACQTAGVMGCIFFKFAHNYSKRIFHSNVYKSLTRCDICHSFYKGTLPHISMVWCCARINWRNDYNGGTGYHSNRSYFWYSFCCFFGQWQHC